MFNYHCLNPWIFQARLPVALYGASRALCPCAVPTPLFTSGHVPQVHSGDMQVRRCAPVFGLEEGTVETMQGGRQTPQRVGRSVGGPALCGCCSPSVAAVVGCKALRRWENDGTMTVCPPVISGTLAASPPQLHALSCEGREVEP